MLDNSSILILCISSAWAKWEKYPAFSEWVEILLCPEQVESMETAELDRMNLAARAIFWAKMCSIKLRSLKGSSISWSLTIVSNEVPPPPPLFATWKTIKISAKTLNNYDVRTLLEFFTRLTSGIFNQFARDLRLVTDIAF